MAPTVTASQTTVAATATLIATGLIGASWIHFHAPAGGNQIYIGGSTVTTANGFELHKGQTVSIWLPENAEIYGIVSTGTEVLPWLLTGGA